MTVENDVQMREYGVLWAIIRDQEKEQILSVLDDSDFCFKDAKLIFKALRLLTDENVPRIDHPFEDGTSVLIIDPLQLADKIKQIEKGSLSKTALKIIIELYDSFASVPDFEGCFTLMKRDRILRDIKLVASESIAMVNEGKPPAEILQYQDEKAYSLYEKLNGKTVEAAKVENILQTVFDQLENPKLGLKTGFHLFDSMSGGLKGGKLYAIVGRPSMGKTSFAINIAENISVSERMGVLIFSLEMSKEELVSIMVCSRAGVSPSVIANGEGSASEHNAIKSVATELSSVPLYIDDAPGVTLSEIRRKSRDLKKQYGIQVIIIDYLQLIRSDENKKDNRNQEIGRVSRGLKALARELDIPIIALVQLNRDVDKREDHKPRLSDLRDSGELEQDVDLVVSLYREEYYNPSTENCGIATGIIMKQRTGPTGQFDFGFKRELMRFHNLLW